MIALIDTTFDVSSGLSGFADQTPYVKQFDKIFSGLDAALSVAGVTVEHDHALWHSASFKLVFQSGAFANGATLLIDGQKTVNVAQADLPAYSLVLDPKAKLCGDHAVAITQHNATSAGDIAHKIDMTLSVDCPEAPLPRPIGASSSITVDAKTPGYSATDQCTATTCPVQNELVKTSVDAIAIPMSVPLPQAIPAWAKAVAIKGNLIGVEGKTVPIATYQSDGVVFDKPSFVGASISFSYTVAFVDAYGFVGTPSSFAFLFSNDNYPVVTIPFQCVTWGDATLDCANQWEASGPGDPCKGVITVGNVGVNWESAWDNSATVCHIRANASHKWSPPSNLSYAGGLVRGLGWPATLALQVNCPAVEETVEKSVSVSHFFLDPTNFRTFTWDPNTISWCKNPGGLADPNAHFVHVNQ